MADEEEGSLEEVRHNDHTLPAEVSGGQQFACCDQQLGSASACTLDAETKNFSNKGSVKHSKFRMNDTTADGSSGVASVYKVVSRKHGGTPFARHIPA